MRNLDLLIPEPPQKQDAWRWGVVVSTSPLGVILDGESAPLGIVPTTLDGSETVGDRVWVQISGQRAIIHGTSNPSQLVTSEFSPPAETSWLPRDWPNGISLRNTGAADNWPANDAVLETIRVVNSANVTQRVTARPTYVLGSAVWVRSSIDEMTWGPWCLESGDSGWISLSGMNGWTAHTSYPPAMRVKNGFALCRGAMNGTLASGSAITVASMPSILSDFYPESNKFFPSIMYNNSNRHGRIQAQANGTIYVDTSPDGSISAINFDNLSWPINDDDLWN